MIAQFHHADWGANLVAIAEGYLKQIDLRKRQVAVRVQILDVDLLIKKTLIIVLL